MQGGVTLGATAALLRQRTQATHEQVEADLDLLAPSLTPARLRAVLVRFESFWRPGERLLAPWAEGSPGLSADLQWTRRCRAEHLAADVLALGGRPDPVAAPTPLAEPTTDADALGWYYVSEGSSLGGAVISRRLAPMIAGLGVALSSFVPYAEGPGPMWRQYRQVLDTWVGEDDVRAHAVAAAAAATFAALAAWVRPLRIPAVA